MIKFWMLLSHLPIGNNKRDIRNDSWAKLVIPGLVFLFWSNPQANLIKKFLIC